MCVHPEFQFLEENVYSTRLNTAGDHSYVPEGRTVDKRDQGLDAGASR